MNAPKERLPISFIKMFFLSQNFAIYFDFTTVTFAETFTSYKLKINLKLHNMT